MSFSFDNAPLMEIIAELRWNPSFVGQAPMSPFPQGIQQPQIVIGSHVVEEFLMRFGGEVYQRDYRLAERLIPPGLPIMPHQTVCRYRSASPEKKSTLYQAGLGTFTAHAIPPYKSWTEFKPVVAEGIDALLAARHPEESSSPFYPVRLRYINAFRGALTKGWDISSFVSDVLGFTIGLPQVVVKDIPKGQSMKPSIQLSIPLMNDMKLDLGIGEGLANNEMSFLLDMTVSASSPVAADHNGIMAIMNDARNTIHEIFLNVTGPIHDLMQPNEGA